MTTDVTDIGIAPVRKSIVVRAAAADAFRIFTDDIDGWWPRTHHIGKAPMRRVIVEPRVGGRCFTEQVDATECDWGTVLAWEPPSRFVFAWQVTHVWAFQADLAQASEVEVRFTPLGPESTRVDLEHRHFERHGAGAKAMRDGVDTPNGWNGMLQLYVDRLQSVVASTRQGE
jgi:hypothetical protein